MNSKQSPFPAFFTDSATQSALARRFTEEIEKLGVTDFVYSYYPKDFTSDGKVAFECCSEKLNDWHQFFHQQNFEAIDSIGQQVRQSVIPIQWNLRDALAEANPQDHDMFQAALDYGLVSGISIPFYGPAGDFSILVIHEQDIESFLAEQPTLMAESLLLLQHMHARISQYHSQANHVQLTKRESECLTLTAHRKSPEEIASLLGISKRTVNFHLENSNHKLTTKNKFQSVQKALTLGLITV